MPTFRTRLVLLPLTFVALSSPCVGAAQGIAVNTYPRAVAPDSSKLDQSLVDLLAEARQQGLLNATQIQEIADSARRASTPRVPFFDWNSLADETEAAQFWGSSPMTLLPAARLSPGGDQTALFTELAAVLSGGWRFALGTTLAVSTARETEQSGDETESATPQPGDIGFRRFLAGGGNLSLAGFRPVGIANQSAGTHLLMFLPRVWSNIPSLSDAEGVTDFGGEAAVEYQYQRYHREWNGKAMGDRAPAPFLTFHARLGAAAGTNAFHRSIGRSPSAFFPYTVPSLNLNFPNGVKMGVSYFYAFGSLSQQENLRVHLTLAPPRSKENGNPNPSAGNSTSNP